MEKRILTALIGCGQRGRAHARAVAGESRLEVVAVCDRNEDAARAVCRDFGFGARTYADHRTMLAAEKIDLVVISLWTRLHLEVIRDVAAAGIPMIHSDKPVAANWGDYLEIARIAEESRCQLTFCHQFRLSAGNRLARRYVAEGVFGDPVHLDLFAWPHLLDCGTHTFDIAMGLNGETSAKWVLGAVDASAVKDNFTVLGEAMMVGNFAFRNGVGANVQIGGPDRYMGGGVRYLGTKGFFEVDWFGTFLRYAVYGDPSWAPEHVSDTADDYMTEVVREIVRGHDTGEETQISVQKALRAGEAIFGFYESVRRNARVELPLVGVTDNPFETMLAEGRFGDPPHNASGD